MKEFISLGSNEPGDPTVTVEESEGRIILDYSFPGFFLVDNHREVAGKKMLFKRVLIPSVGSLCESGKPQLPSMGCYLQIPTGHDYSVSVEKRHEVATPVLVWPAQMKMTDSRHKPHVFEFDALFYSTSTDCVYPKEVVLTKGPYKIDETNALLVHVTPFHYNPAKEELLGYGGIKVTVTVRPPDASHSDPHPRDRSQRENTGKLFANPGRGIEKRLGFPPRPQYIRPPGPELLIIHADVLKNAAEKLANWKNSRGLVTEIVSTGSGLCTPADLKSYIHQRRAVTSSRLRYVLLLGDRDDPPTEAIGSRITDYYYSTEDPDPAHPQSHLFPWLAVGRIPLKDPAEAMGAVEQIIHYEKHPPCDHQYYSRMVFAAKFEDEAGDCKDDRGYIETLEYVRSRLEAHGYCGERVYVSDIMGQSLYYQDGDPLSADVMGSIFDLATATSELVAATTEGRLIMCHRGHGDWNGWGGPDFTNTHLDGVCGNMPSVFYNIDCDTGDFNCNGECFAEKNLRLPRAAPSLIASTAESCTIINNDLVKALFDASFPWVLRFFRWPMITFPMPLRRLGDILNYGKSYLPIAVRTEEEQYVKDHFEMYHVIGDPTLELWTRCPLTLTLEARITRYSLEIELSICPMDCVLTIWFQGKMLERIEPSSTFIRVPLRNMPVRPYDGRSRLRVCCWAPGYRYAEVNVNLGHSQAVRPDDSVPPAWGSPGG